MHSNADWRSRQRGQGAKQITGFGLGGAAGIAVGQGIFSGGIAVASAAGLTIAGPIGWAILGTLFLGSLAAGYFAGSLGDSLGQEAAKRIMDLQ